MGRLSDGLKSQGFVVRQCSIPVIVVASGGWSFTTILRTLGGPARGVVRPGRYAPGAG